MNLALRQQSIACIMFFVVAMASFSGAIAAVGAKKTAVSDSDEKNACDAYDKNAALEQAHSKLMMQKHDEEEAIRLDILKREQKLSEEKEQNVKDEKVRVDEYNARLKLTSKQQDDDRNARKAREDEAQKRLLDVRKRNDDFMDASEAQQKRFAKILDRWESQQNEYQKYLDSLPTSTKALH